MWWWCMTDMRQVCLELNLLSEVPASNLERNSPSADKDYGLRGEKRQLGEIWWGYYVAAPDEKERDRVFHRARAVLARQKGRMPVLVDDEGNPLTDDEWGEAMALLYAGERVEFAALATNTSVATINRRFVVERGVIQGLKEKG